MVNIYSYQIKVLEHFMKYKGRGVVQVTSRNSGKSLLSGQAFSKLMDDVLQRPIEDLVLTEGTVYGSRYYCIEPVGGNWLDMELWSLDTFGPTGSIWSETKNLTPEPLQRWYANNRKFWFKDIKDRDWFILRWCS